MSSRQNKFFKSRRNQPEASNGNAARTRPLQTVKLIVEKPPVLAPQAMEGKGTENQDDTQVLGSKNELPKEEVRAEQTDLRPGQKKMYKSQASWNDNQSPKKQKFEEKSLGQSKVFHQGSNQPGTSKASNGNGGEVNINVNKPIHRPAETVQRDKNQPKRTGSKFKSTTPSLQSYLAAQCGIDTGDCSSHEAINIFSGPDNESAVDLDGKGGWLTKSDCPISERDVLRYPWGMEDTMIKIMRLNMSRKGPVTMEVLMDSGTMLPGKPATFSVARAFMSVLKLKQSGYVKILKIPGTSHIADLQLGPLFDPPSSNYSNKKP